MTEGIPITQVSIGKDLKNLFFIFKFYHFYAKNVWFVKRTFLLHRQILFDFALLNNEKSFKSQKTQSSLRFLPLHINKKDHLRSFLFMCRGEDLNLHGLPRLLLRQVRLPFRHSGKYKFLSSRKTFTKLIQSSRIIFVSSNKNFLDHDSTVSSADETCLRLGQVHKRVKKVTLLCLVRPVGIEPTTNRLRGECSTS